MRRCGKLLRVDPGGWEAIGRREDRPGAGITKRFRTAAAAVDARPCCKTAIASPSSQPASQDPVGKRPVHPARWSWRGPRWCCAQIDPNFHGGGGFLQAILDCRVHGFEMETTLPQASRLHELRQIGRGRVVPGL